MPLLLALAAATLTPAQQSADIRCVALLAIVAGEQARGTGDKAFPDIQDDGADFAALVGEEVIKATGATKEAVRDRILAAVSDIQKTKTLPPADITRCIATMKARLPALPPPTLPRCAAIMGLAYDAVKARDGLTKDAKDLATLASVLAYRTREQAIGAGQSMAEADAGIERARDAAKKAGGAPEAELRACATLAAPDKAQ